MSATILTGDQIQAFQLRCLHQALQFHVRTGGKMRLTRVNYLETARSLGYVGRTAQQLLNDMETKHPELKNR